MVEAASPGEILVRQLREIRERRGWSQQRLADELRSFGLPLDRSAVAKIESKTRNVSLDEAITLALALGVSPLALLLPRHDERVRVAPRCDVGNFEATHWFRGFIPLAEQDTDVESRRFFHDATSDREAEAIRRYPELIRLLDGTVLALHFAESDEMTPALKSVLKTLVLEIGALLRRAEEPESRTPAPSERPRDEKSPKARSKKSGGRD